MPLRKSWVTARSKAREFRKSSSMKKQRKKQQPRSEIKKRASKDSVTAYWLTALLNYLMISGLT